jgi:SAM-dependent methyltransferase
MRKLEESIGLSEIELRGLSPSPLVRKFGRELVIEARAQPILDVACGGGRNSALLAQLGGRVIGIDIDLQRVEAERIAWETTTLGPAFRDLQLLRLDLLRSTWPYGPSSVGGIVNIHYFQKSLLSKFCTSLLSGGFLILETVEARGGNYRQLPKTGELRAMLDDSVSFLVYKEHRVNVEGVDAVAVKVVGRKH